MLYRYKILIAALVVLGLFSCKKILNPEVIDSPTGANAFRSSEDIDKGIAAAYSFLRTAVPDKIFLFGDVRAYNFSSPSFTSNVRAETTIPQNSGAALLNNGGGDWGAFYRTIAQCNLLLERIPSISNYDAVTKKRHIGEASFIRALAYFYLVRFWGDVPLNLSSIDIDNIPRSPQADVLKQINSDLDIAIANLQIVYSTTDKAIRATKGAAWAIKAHVMGWMQDYSSCEKLCDSVINKGNYTMIADTAALVKMFVGKSTESIFELNFDYQQGEVAKLKVFNRPLGRPWYTDQSDGGAGRDDLLLTPTANQLLGYFPIGIQDGRRYQWFVPKNIRYKNATYNIDGKYLGKYKTLAANADTTSQNINESNIIITRLADIILLRAEALASNGIARNADAATLLNLVRGRAKTKLYNLANPGSLQDTILLERRKELIGEGQFFFDLVRTRKMDKYSLITDAGWYAKGAWLLPINQAIIAQSNFVITQNDFWK